MKPTALITGASGGIGLDLAHEFARDKYDVVLLARTEPRLREIAAELEREHGISATVIAADLAGPNAARQIVEELRRRNLTIDALVNNAGFGLTGPFVDLDLDAQLEIIQVNITALVHLTGLLLPDMVRRRKGRILNLASTAAFQPGPLMAVYYASKAFVLSFSEAIADELRDSGVTVTALCPGPTATGFASAAGMVSTRLFNLTRPMTSAAVARIGYAGMKKGHRVVVTGLRNKLMAQSVRVSPRRVVTTIVRKLQETRR
jgi:short-subunit dehydrogenase